MLISPHARFNQLAWLLITVDAKVSDSRNLWLFLVSHNCLFHQIKTGAGKDFLRLLELSLWPGELVASFSRQCGRVEMCPRSRLDGLRADISSPFPC